MIPTTPLATTSPEAVLDDGPVTREIPAETIRECVAYHRAQLERAGLCEARQS